MGKKKRKKLSRDTQFKRYAAQFWQELETALRIEGINIRSYTDKKACEVAEPVLTKRLHDFADHCTQNTVFTFAKDIPDLTEED